MWRVEVGDDNAPGCTFHIQVLGECLDPPFPKSLSVPRFPSILTTFGDVLEFVLGELFQDDWKKHVNQQSRYVESWRPFQKKRFSRIFNWQENLIKESQGGSPWMSLKQAQPPETLFTE